MRRDATCSFLPCVHDWTATRAVDFQEQRVDRSEFVRTAIISLNETLDDLAAAAFEWPLHKLQ